MKRLLFGLLTALIVALIAGVAPTYAASGAPPRGIGGQVTGIDGTTITVKTRQGTATIATTSSTTFEVNGASGTLSGIAVGMFVRAEGTKAADGTFTATKVIASSSAPMGGRPPRGNPGVGGQVTAIDSTTITVKNPQGTATIVTTSSTTFEVNGASATLSGITVGMFVRAEGAKAADGTFTATKVIASSTLPARGPGR